MLLKGIAIARHMKKTIKEKLLLTAKQAENAHKLAERQSKL